MSQVIRQRLAFSVRVLWVLTLLASLGMLLASLPGYFYGRLMASPSAEFSTVSTLSHATTWLGNGLSLGAASISIALACILVVKKARDAMALVLAFFLLFYGIIMAGPLESFTLYWLPQNPDLGTQLQSVLFPLPSLVLILTFPNGHFVPRWTRGLPLLAVLLVLLSLMFDLEEAVKLNTLRAQVVIGGLWLMCFFALGIQAYRYRMLYTPIERQQSKWVVYGTGLWVALVILTGIPYIYQINLPADAPAPWWLPFASVAWWLAMSIMPIAFTLAIMRSRLWDIDFIIHRTVTYALLTALLLAVYFGGVVVLQRMFVAVAGQSSEVAIILSTLAIAALFVPLRSRIQAIIDRRFFRAKYDAANVLESFAHTVRDEVDTTQLTAKLLDSVEETLRPESVGLWLRETPVGDPTPHRANPGQ